MLKGSKRMTHEEYVAEVSMINSNIEVVGKYIDCKTNILHRCKICGYLWDVRPSSITGGSGCPNCNRHNKASAKELKVYYYLKKYFPDAISGYQDKSNRLSELDMYVPSLKCGIEFDGELYHQDVDRDKRKDRICKNLGIKLIRIREPGCPKYDSSCVFIYLNSYSNSNLELIITYILEALGVVNPVVDFKIDMQYINNQLCYIDRGENSLAVRCPEVAAEWHPIKNGNLKPEYVTYGSNINVWWLCSKCNNEWQREVNRRTYDGRGCPRCASTGVPTMVYCLELNKIFTNMSEASRACNISNKHISACCRKLRGSAGTHNVTGEKLHWYYVEDRFNENGIFTKGAISLGLITRKDVDDFVGQLRNTSN